MKRAKHYEDIQKIRDEIKTAEQKNNALISGLEKELLDTRITLQFHTDSKVKALEEQAQDRAATYLSSHTTLLTRENQELEVSLRNLTASTQRLILRRDQIARVLEELQRQVCVRDDLVAIRAARIGKAVLYRGIEKRKSGERRAKWRRDVVEGRLKGDAVVDGMPDDWIDDGSDDDD